MSHPGPRLILCSVSINLIAIATILPMICILEQTTRLVLGLIAMFTVILGTDALMFPERWGCCCSSLPHESSLQPTLRLVIELTSLLPSPAARSLSYACVQTLTDDHSEEGSLSETQTELLFEIHHACTERVRWLAENQV